MLLTSQNMRRLFHLWLFLINKTTLTAWLLLLMLHLIVIVAMILVPVLVLGAQTL
jgi:hypothetical protein